MATISKEAGRYVITRSRFIEGQYVEATAQFPAVIEVPAGYKVDAGMTPVEKYRQESNLKPHYVIKRAAHAAPGAIDEAAKPAVVVVETGIEGIKPSVSGAPAASQTFQGGKGKRPSDSSPV